MNINGSYTQEEINRHKQFVSEERARHPYKHRFSEVGIANSYGSIPVHPDHSYKLIEGFSQQYAVNNLGWVVSFSTGRILKPGRNENGYCHVGLSKDGVETTVKVHRLVAEAFCPNARGLNVIHHIDLVRHHNTPDNLLWCSKEEHSELHKLYDAGNIDAYNQRVQEILASNQ